MLNFYCFIRVLQVCVGTEGRTGPEDGPAISKNHGDILNWRPDFSG